MNEIVKSVPFTLLLRGLMPGGFFVISFLVAKVGWLRLETTPKYDILSKWLPLAAFSGVVAYTIHRSILYPLIELVLDGLDNWR